MDVSNQGMLVDNFVQDFDCYQFKTNKFGFKRMIRSGKIELPSLLLSQNKGNKIYYLDDFNIIIDNDIVIFRKSRQMGLSTRTFAIKLCEYDISELIRTYGLDIKKNFSIVGSTVKLEGFSEFADGTYTQLKDTLRNTAKFQSTVEIQLHTNHK